MKSLILHDDMIQDFQAWIRRYGHDPADYKVEARDAPIPPGGVVKFYPTGYVVVTNERTGVQKEYEAGNGSAWYVDAAEDVIAGAFNG